MARLRVGLALGSGFARGWSRIGVIEAPIDADIEPGRGYINIMQDQITCARLAGEPPHVMLVPRLRDIALLELNRASEAIAEGRACVEQAPGSLRRFTDRRGGSE